VKATSSSAWASNPSVFGGLGHSPAPSVPNTWTAFRRSDSGRYAPEAAINATEFADSDVEIDASPTQGWGHGQSTAIPQANGSDLLRDIEPRLRELQTQYIDDYGQQILPKSMLALRILLLSINGLRRPALSAEPSGHLIATWRKLGLSVSLRLLGPLEVHYVLTTPVSPQAAGPSIYGRSTPTTFFVESVEALRIAR
jgi:hypothetical protein